MPKIADTPAPPYYAVIFTSLLREGANPAYAAMAERMVALAQDQAGFLGYESARQGLGITVSYWESPEDQRRQVRGLGITVSYWESPEAIRAWRMHAEHQIAQERGKTEWYRAYRIRICRVEREYPGP